MAGFPVTGDLYFELHGKLLEVTRQLRQKGGYPFDPQLLDAALQLVIEGKFGPMAMSAPVAPAPAPFVPVTLPSWFTVRLGVYKTVEAYIAAFEAKGMKIGTYARQILAKILIASEENDLELFLGSVRDFGFTRNTPRRQIFERAALSGYYPCPAEVGPAARLQYPNQPKGEWRLVAMEPIEDSDRFLRLFDLGHDGGGLRLDADNGHPDDEWGPAYVWVWCRRKP